MSFYITFGMKYGSEAHPVHGSWAVHPDGWVRVEAPDRDTAMEWAFTYFGQGWAFLYDQDDWEPERHPMGELGVLDKDGLRLARDNGLLSWKRVKP